MELIQRRRGLIGSKEPEEELYPVGTDVIYKYIRSVSSDPSNPWVALKIDRTTGDMAPATNSNCASEIFMEINPKYTYTKGAQRFQTLAFYDANYAYLSFVGDWDLTERVLPIPQNAKYMRVEIGTGSRTSMKIVRTA